VLNSLLLAPARAAAAPGEARALLAGVDWQGLAGGMSTIVVALDTSPRAAGVLRRAALLAKASHAKLILLRAVGLPQDLPMELYGISPDALPGKLVDQARTALESHIPELAGIDVVIDAHIGTPWRTICQVAEEQKADLIVIGTHGHTVLDTLLGTTAARVVNHATCSVLVVREPAAG
jgi:nucleotide-binding universal stress UspA family protein